MKNPTNAKISAKQKRQELIDQVSTGEGLWRFLTDHDGMTYETKTENHRAEPPRRRPKMRETPGDRFRAVNNPDNPDYHKFRLGGPGLKSCKHCRRVAVKDLDVCYYHGGKETVIERKRARGEFIGSTAHIAFTKANRLMRAKLIDPDLIKQPAFLAVWGVAEGRKADGTKTNSWEDWKHSVGNTDAIERRVQAKKLTLEIIKAWHVLKTQNDFGPWLVAVEKAKKLGAI